MSSFNRIILFVLTLWNPDIGVSLATSSFGYPKQLQQLQPQEHDLFTKYIRIPKSPSINKTLLSFAIYNDNTEENESDSDVTIESQEETNPAVTQIEELLHAKTNIKPYLTLLNVILKLFNPDRLDTTNSCCVKKNKQVIELIKHNFKHYEQEIMTCNAHHDSNIWSGNRKDVAKYGHSLYSSEKTISPRLFKPRITRSHLRERKPNKSKYIEPIRMYWYKKPQDDNKQNIIHTETNNYNRLTTLTLCKRTAVLNFLKFANLFLQIRDLLASCETAVHAECGKKTAFETYTNWDAIYSIVSVFKKSVLNHKENTSININKIQTQHFPKSLFAYILKDLLLQLEVIGGTNIKLQELKLKADVAKRCKVHQLSLEEEYNLIFRDDDKHDERKVVTRIIEGTYNDLLFHNNYYTLSSFLDAEIDKRKHYDNLMVEAKSHKQKRQDLYKTLRNKKNNNKATNHEVTVKIQDLKRVLDEEIQKIYISSRYAFFWEKSRNQQQKIALELKQKKLKASIDKYKYKIESERRAYDEIDTFLKFCIDEAFRKIEECMNKYDHDIEDIEFQISLQSNNALGDVRAKSNELKDTFQCKNDEMNKYINHKAKLVKVKLHHENMSAAAKTVQAWWRGILVRKRLGPYKKRRTVKRHRKS